MIPLVDTVSAMRSHEIHRELRELHYAIGDDISLLDNVRQRDWPGKIPEPLRSAYLVCMANGVIGNGGFRYFFENDWPSHLSYRQFEKAYRVIGADHSADLLVQAAAYFPFKNPEKDCDRRRKILDEMEADESVKSPMDQLGAQMIDIAGEAITQLIEYCLGHPEFFPKLVGRKAELEDDRINWRTKP